MKEKSVKIVATGIANIASLRCAFKRIGIETELVDEPSTVLSAPLVVLPGVGAFGAGIDKLACLELDVAIKERIKVGLPLLSICLGFQLLCKSSEESSGVDGLGVLDAKVVRFQTSNRIPQLGWNFIDAPSNSRFLRSGYAYFANSFCVKNLSGVDIVASSDYGHTFVAAFEKDMMLGCQFHPELSGEFGAAIIKRWVELSS